MASLGGFTFATDEQPPPEADTGWVTTLKLDRVSPLGSAKDSIVTLAVGSATRAFEVWLTLARYATLAGLVNTVVSFTDWEAVPNTRNAFVAGVNPVDYSGPWSGETGNMVRVRVELVSQ